MDLLQFVFKVLAALFLVSNTSPSSASSTRPGALDPSFRSPVMDGQVKAIAVEADGDILIGGTFSMVDGIHRQGMARLKSDGHLEETFGSPASGTNEQVLAIALQTDGKILVGGQFTQFAGKPLRGIARLNMDGSVDSSFNPGTGIRYQQNTHLERVSTIALQPDGLILIGGYFDQYNGTARKSIARLLPDGSLDGTFAPNIYLPNESFPMLADVRQITIQPDNKVLISGAFEEERTPENLFRLKSQAILRTLPNGTIDSSFLSAIGQPKGSVQLVFLASAFGLQTGNKIVAGGSLWSDKYPFNHPLERLNNDGSADTNFVQTQKYQQDFSLNRILVEAENRIIVAGDFDNFGGVPATNIARLHPSGVLDASFISEAAPSAPVEAVALQADGQILAGGEFQIGTNKTGIVRLLGHDQSHHSPRIIREPQNLAGLLGDPAVFYVAAEGGSLQYRWQFFGADIPGATNNFHLIPATISWHRGTYRVIVRNSLGETISAPASLTALELAEALDTPGWTWKTGSMLDGNADAKLWIPQTHDTVDGWDAAIAEYKAGVLQANETAPWLETQIQGPGTLSFQWKTGQHFFPEMAFLVNGREVKRTRSLAWTFETVELPAGICTLRWEVQYGSGPAYLDQVKFVSFRPTLSVKTQWNGNGLPIFAENLTLGNYRLEWSSNLVHWSTLTQFTATNITMTVNDAENLTYRQRFYRLVLE